MKPKRKIPPLKLEAEVEREFFESSITFVGRPRARVQAAESSYNVETLPRLQRGQLNFQPAEVLLTLAIIALTVVFALLVGMGGRFTALKFDPPARAEAEAPAQVPLTSAH